MSYAVIYLATGVAYAMNAMLAPSIVDRMVNVMTAIKAIRSRTRRVYAMVMIVFVFTLGFVTLAVLWPVELAWRVYIAWRRA